MTTQRDTDLDLLERWRAGDRTAGDALVKHYFGQIQKFFARSVLDDNRQDLAQETFARLVKAKEGFRGASSVRTFLFGIARHVLHDHFRKRDQSYDPITQTLEDMGAATPSRAVATLRQHERLLASMQALPIDTKVMLEMYYWEGFTAEQMAEIYDIPAATVRTRIHSARTRLSKGMMSRAGTPAAPANVAEAETNASDADDEIARELRAIGQLLAHGPTSV